MNIKEISDKLEKISDMYAEKFNIRRDDDWFIIKIQEELGELSSAYLKLTQRARLGTDSKEKIEINLKEEVADVIALTLLFARHQNIDVERALQDKWFKYLE